MNSVNALSGRQARNWTCLAVTVKHADRAVWYASRAGFVACMLFDRPTIQLALSLEVVLQ